MRNAKRPSTLTLQPLYNRIEVQCTDPDMKREALSELFDHCMTPITATFPIAAGSRYANAVDGSSPFSREHRQLRPRPLSAAPLLEVDVYSAFASREAGAMSMDIGLLSPLSLSEGAVVNGSGGNIATTLCSQQHNPFDDAAFESADDGSLSSCCTPGQLGTFAALRRKLYGGDVHVDDNAASSFGDSSDPSRGAAVQRELSSF
ncbi:hypothetical protein LPJ59_000478 [Coemansia sp. RSA 2399]|nr:hypothetical protein LPJ59_000478 [Coemansia sp. RSA 2399]KAJ1905329.1 hypothetical protein LPJ81_001982 [Coemansia sp. IMI 209127]